MQKCSLVIAAYNQEKELELVFHALTIQTFTDFEVVIADDGSGIETDKLIKKWKTRNVFPVNHVKHEHVGFRVAAIHNKAVTACSTDYIIFIDADCIPHSDLIKKHYTMREENHVLCGRRVDLNKKYSDKMTKESILSKEYEKIGLHHIIDSFKKNGPKGIEFGWKFNTDIFKKLSGKKDIRILGSNFSLHKSLIEKLNGFDENFTGYGYGFDSEFELRLRIYGAKFKSLRNHAIQYHLYHKKRFTEKKNEEYFEQMKINREYFCKNGLVKVI